jgi:hypothetical protein
MVMAQIKVQTQNMLGRTEVKKKKKYRDILFIPTGILQLV